MDTPNSASMILSRAVCAAALLLCSALPAGATRAASPEMQRETFLAAERAWQRGDSPKYRQLKRQLSDYPLQP